MAGSCVLGVLVAVLLTSHRRGKPLRGRAIIGGLLLAPFVAPPVVSAYVWTYLYSGSGPINGVLNGLGVAEPVYFLGDTVTKILGRRVAAVVDDPGRRLVRLPVLLPDVRGRADLDPGRAARGGRDRRGDGLALVPSIILPLIAPVLEVTIFLELLFRLGGLDLPFLLTGGGPLGATNVWGVFIYQVGFARLEIGYGAALGVVLFLLCTPVRDLVRAPLAAPAGGLLRWPLR